MPPENDTYSLDERQRPTCRQLGTKAGHPDLKAHYERMADIWDKLAEERLAFVVEDPEEDAHGEVVEDGATG